MAVQGFEEGENSSCRALAWTSCGITSAIFFWSSQVRAVPDSREGNLSTPPLGVVAKPLCKRAHTVPSLGIIGKRKKKLSLEEQVMWENSIRQDDSGFLSVCHQSGISLECTSIPEKTVGLWRCTGRMY